MLDLKQRKTERQEHEMQANMEVLGVGVGGAEYI